MEIPLSWRIVCALLYNRFKLPHAEWTCVMIGLLTQWPMRACHISLRRARPEGLSPQPASPRPPFFSAADQGAGDAHGQALLQCLPWLGGHRAARGRAGTPNLTANENI